MTIKMESDKEFEVAVDEMYHDVILDTLTHELEGNQSCKVILSEEYGQCSLSRIEEFVGEVLNDQSPAYLQTVFEGKYPELKPLKLSRYFSKLDGFINNYNNDLIFSPYVSLFFEAASKLRLFSFDGIDNPYTYYPEVSLTGAQILNAIIKQIRILANKKSFKKKIYGREFNCTRNLKSTIAYIDLLFEKFSRLLVLRIDFFLKNDSKDFKHRDKISQAQTYLRKFLNNHRTNSIFKDVVGYIWKLEYGLISKYHYHCIFFLDGSKSHKDEYRALQIGKYWEKITNGNGYHYNGNRMKRHYDKIGVGIGMISHSDLPMRKNLNRIVHYFFKKEQFIKVKYLEKMRVFGKGEMRKSKHNAAGRPRQQSPT